MRRKAAKRGYLVSTKSEAIQTFKAARLRAFDAMGLADGVGVSVHADHDTVRMLASYY